MSFMTAIYVHKAMYVGIYPQNTSVVSYLWRHICCHLSIQTPLSSFNHKYTYLPITIHIVVIWSQWHICLRLCTETQMLSSNHRTTYVAIYWSRLICRHLQIESHLLSFYHKDTSVIEDISIRILIHRSPSIRHKTENKFLSYFNQIYKIYKSISKLTVPFCCVRFLVIISIRSQVFVIQLEYGIRLRRIF